MELPDQVANAAQPPEDREGEWRIVISSRYGRAELAVSIPVDAYDEVAGRE